MQLQPYYIIFVYLTNLHPRDFLNMNSLNEFNTQTINISMKISNNFQIFYDIGKVCNAHYPSTKYTHVP